MSTDIKIDSSKKVSSLSDYQIDENDRFSSLPDFLIEKILLNLPPSCITQMRQVSRKFANITSAENNSFWMMICKKDIGKNGVKPDENGSYHELYKKKYKEMLLFLKKLPEADSLLTESRKDEEKILFGLVSKRALELYIQNLFQPQLQKVLFLSSEFGSLPILEAIIRSPKFAEVSFDDENEGFVEILCQAITSTEAFQMLSQSSKFDEIDLDGLFQILACAASYGQTTIMKTIMENEKLDDPFFFYNGAAEVLECATREGQIDSINLLLQHPKLREREDILLPALFSAFIGGAENGQLNSMQRIMEDPLFKKIDLFDLFFQAINRCAKPEKPYFSAHSGDRAAAMGFLICHPAFKAIDQTEDWELGRAICLLSNKKAPGSDALDIILKSQRLLHIDANGEGGLGKAICMALDTDQKDAIWVLISHPKFKEINVCGNYGIGEIFCNAARFNHIDIMEMIKNDPRFDKIELRSYRSLSEAFCNSIYASSDAMKIVMSHPEFNKILANGQFGIGQAFSIAAEIRNLEAINLIMSDPRFNQISHIGEAFCTAAFYNKVEAMKMMMSNDRFKDIPVNEEYGFSAALERAIFSNSFASIQLLIQHPYFKKIDLKGTGKCDLIKLFLTAVIRNNISVMKIIMEDPRFNQMDDNIDKGIGQAFCLSINSDDTKPMFLLRKSPRFDNIGARGPYGLGHALFLAKQHGNKAAIELIASSKRYSEIDLKEDFTGFGQNL